MPNCFVFAIGGTGSRVLRSLTHLLATGVKPKNNFDIIPIIIDPHNDCIDLQRAVTLMDFYKAIKKEAEPTESEGFFPTTIKTLKDLDSNNSELPISFTFNLEGSTSRFSDYIDYHGMGEENAALADLLFSGYSKDKDKHKCKLLDIEMSIGFQGNPNVGTVVLNQIVESKVYKAFATKFATEDRIFIISSIFGGTGAAGFPCLLKNIRDGKGTSEDAKSKFLKEAKIGAVSILPYFKLQENPDSTIAYTDFVAKTKSALHYYKDNVTNGQVNAMYYVGNETGESYKNDSGHEGQKNDANFVEVVAALAIVDYLSLNDSELTADPIYREFGIEPKAESIPQPNFYDLGEANEKILKRPLSRFALFRKFMKEEFPKKMGKIGWSTATPKLDEDFKNTPFYRYQMNKFFEDFENWLEELRKNNRGFAPFNFNADLSMLINGMPEEIKNKIKFTYDGKRFNSGFDDYLNNFSKTKYIKPEQKLLDMFYRATKEILEKEYNMK